MSAPDLARLRDELVALKEPERRKRAAEAERELVKGARARPAAVLAWAGTATARKIGSGYWRVGSQLNENPGLADDVYAILAARGRAFFETVARGLLREELSWWGGWTLVRRAVREGLIEPPGDDYVRGLVAGVALGQESFYELESVYEGLLADPALLEREVWQLFEVDLGTELGNANAWERAAGEGRGPPALTRGENRWLYALKRLAAEGHLDRQRLLDASLDALMRDFRASGIGWYAQLHEELEPTREERLARLDRYLGLVTSPAPAAVKEGLAVLRVLEDAVPPDAFARVAPTPFTQRQKNLSTETLSLLARLCKRHPDARPVLLEAAAHALAHERTDVQERALALLELHAEDAPRAALLGYVEAVSPPLRPRVEALTGVAAPPLEAGELELRAPVQPRVTPELVREVRPPVEPVGSVDELIELAAMLVEGRGDGDDCERFLDGVSRLCDRRPPGFERRTAGLAKRAESGGDWGFEASGAGLVAYVVKSWARRRRPSAVGGHPGTVIGFLASRAEEVARRAARGLTRPLLALPTHAGGWIDPDVRAARERAAGRFFNRPAPIDRLQATVRAFPEAGPIRYERRVRETTRSGYTLRQLRLGCPAAASLGELRSAVALAGSAESRNAWYGPVGWAGVDPLGARWAVTVLPSLPEVAFAGAATAAVYAREAASYHQPDVVLEHALDRHVPLGPEAWLATAACLVARSPDLPRTATDLVVAAIEDGRFDADALGAEIAWLVDNDFAKVNRLEAPLRDVARLSPLHAAHVARTIEALLARLGSRPRGLHGILDVALASTTVTGRRLEDADARATLERVAGELSASSKLGRLARALLAT